MMLPSFTATVFFLFEYLMFICMKLHFFYVAMSHPGPETINYLFTYYSVTTPRRTIKLP